MNTSTTPDRCGAEPFAFALLQWPALVGVLSLDGSGWLQALRITLGACLAITVLAAYSGRRGPGFGNTMLFLLVCVAGAWWSHPSAWALAWLAPLLVGLNAAQRALARRTAAPIGEQSETALMRHG